MGIIMMFPFFSDLFGKNKNQFFEVYSFCVTYFSRPTLMGISSMHCTLIKKSILLIIFQANFLSAAMGDNSDERSPLLGPRIASLRQSEVKMFSSRYCVPIGHFHFHNFGHSYLERCQLLRERSRTVKFHG